MNTYKFHFICLVLFSLFYTVGQAQGNQLTLDDPAREKARELYNYYCVGCHDRDLGNFKKGEWKFGSSLDSVTHTIKHGRDDAGMPSFEPTFSSAELEQLAKFLLITSGQARKED